MTCKTKRRASANGFVRIAPSREILIRFDSGSSRCVTTRGQRRKYDTPQGTIVVSDPLFGVDVSRKRTIVDVVYGFAEVRGRIGRTVVVGPGQQTVVHRGRAASPPAPSSLPAGDPDVEDLRSKLPRPTLKRPYLGTSVPAGRIERQGLLVAYDPDVEDPRAERFVERFFEYLGSRWRVRAKVEEVADDKAAALLKQGQIDVWATPDAPQLRLRPLFPFLEDASGPKPWHPWYVVPRRDKYFDPAFRDFLIATLENGVYAKLYKAIYATTPPYRFFDSILFPP
jgi:hypothetical protein